MRNRAAPNVHARPMAMVMPMASSVRNAQEEEHDRAEHHEHAVEADVPEIVLDRLVLLDAGDEVAGVADLHARIEATSGSTSATTASILARRRCAGSMLPGSTGVRIRMASSLPSSPM